MNHYQKKIQIKFFEQEYARSRRQAMKNAFRRTWKELQSQMLADEFYGYGIETGC